LLGGFLLYALGAAAAVRMGVAINWTSYLLGQIVVMFIQLAAHYLNEYYDIDVDQLTPSNRTWFSGGSGILSTGGVSPSSALTAAYLCVVMAALAGILASMISPWMIPIILIALLASWFYASPPISLVSSGWGELTTSILVALLVPLAGYCMQKGFPPGELWLICIPLVLVHIAMLISFEFPDRTADQSAGKNTLTVRLGFQNAAWLVSALIGFAFLLLTILILFSNYPLWWMELSIPLAIWQIVMIHRTIHTPTRTYYYILTMGGAGLFVVMSLLAFLGFVFIA
jgi:1,4-dihydroxy-2-naphthoate polyprenyltransferase